MNSQGRWAAALVIAVMTALGASAQPTTREELTERVRNTILKLPYYGAYDLIVFSVDGRDVTLGGYVNRASLKREAREEVREIPGIGRVLDKIEILPTSQSDDLLRRRVFRAIYTDSFLAHYGTPVRGTFGRRPWGRGFDGWPGFRGGDWARSPYLGMEPLGNHAIHIVVKRGRVGLFGEVRTETERRRAEQVAGGVFGVFSVDNRIQVAERDED